jgi:hypothetical protein
MTTADTIGLFELQNTFDKATPIVEVRCVTPSVQSNLAGTACDSVFELQSDTVEMISNSFATRKNLSNVVESVLVKETSHTELLCAVKWSTNLDTAIAKICKYRQHYFERGVDAP